MTFDLTDWWPVRMVGGLDWRVELALIVFLGAAIAVTFHLVKAVRNSGIAWVRNHHVVVSVLIFVWCGMTVFTLGRMILDYPAADTDHRQLRRTAGRCLAYGMQTAPKNAHRHL